MLRQLVTKFGDFVREKVIFWQLVANFVYFQQNNSLFVKKKINKKITHLKISATREIHVERMNSTKRNDVGNLLR